MAYSSGRPVVGVLMGGTSGEREVSIRSGAAVSRALGGLGYKVIDVDIRSETGRELDGHDLDVAFIALHGRFGEDGRLQRLLDGRKIPYTGSGPDASRTAMDKIESKRLFKLRGVDTPPHRVIARGDSSTLLEQCARALGYPVVIKPRAEGSSIGVTLHRDCSTLAAGAEECFRHDAIGIMEKFIAGREFTVGLLDGKTLPIIEMKTARGFFDFEAKYADPGTQYAVDPAMGDLERRRVLRAAKEAYDSLGCEGMGRVDLILTSMCSVHVLEVNTIPGMTERSLLPKAALAAGIGFPQLCQRLTEGAFHKRDSTFWAAAML